MKKRLVIFKGQTAWFMTPEFIGDKEELAQESATRSCDENWDMIARKFTQAKTKQEFSEVSTWAQGLYHDNAVSVKPQRLLSYQLPDVLPDEILVVYEDLAITGIQIITNCATCGRTHFMIYRPDKTSENTKRRCLTCASKLVTRGAPPSLDAWSNALDMYEKPAPSYRMAVPGDFPEIKETLLEAAAKKHEELKEEDLITASNQWLSEIMQDCNAATHMNAPVKLLKIIGYSGDEFIFQVMFRDWSTAVVRSRFLKPLK